MAPVPGKKRDRGGPGECFVTPSRAWLHSTRQSLLRSAEGGHPALPRAPPTVASPQAGPGTRPHAVSPQDWPMHGDQDGQVSPIHGTNGTSRGDFLDMKVLSHNVLKHLASAPAR